MPVTSELLPAPETPVTAVNTPSGNETSTPLKLFSRAPRTTIAPAVKPDSQGLLHWELTLKPGEKREFRISYQVEYPRELIIDARRRREARPARNYEFDDMASPYQAGEAAAAPMPAPAKSMNMEDQIMDLESQL